LGGHDDPAERAAAEALLGIPVVAPDVHVRHLGILLSAAGQAAANLAMFEKRRVGGLLRVRAWARFDLSYLGRLQVAKQVLASSLYYHASFVPPPADKLDGIIRLIDHVVANGRVLEGEEGVAPIRKVPSAAVETLLLSETHFFIFILGEGTLQN
jgi:hypothetical protein